MFEIVNIIMVVNNKYYIYLFITRIQTNKKYLRLETFVKFFDKEIPLVVVWT